MSGSKTILFGILGAILVGSLLSAAGATMKGKLDDSPMTIPMSRVGDKVFYGEFLVLDKFSERLAEMFPEENSSVGVGGASSDQTQAPSPGEPVLTSTSLYFLQHMKKTLDRDGRLRDVLFMISNQTGEGQSWTQYDYVDVATRGSIRQDDKMLWGRQPKEDILVTRYGNFGEPLEGFLMLQGWTIRLGEDILDRIPEDGTGVSWSYGQSSGTHKQEVAAGVSLQQRHFRITMTYDETPYSTEDMGPPEDFRLWVADRALVGGHDAYGIRGEMEEQLGADEGDEFFSQLVGGNRMYMQMTMWVTADIPYPILLEFEMGRADGSVREPMLKIAKGIIEYKEGADPIVWGASTEPGPAPAWERSPSSGTVPADGQGVTLPYPLSRALQHVNGPLRPPAFGLWSMQNPGAVLVSAELRQSETGVGSSPAHMWHLIFARPDGAAYELSVERRLEEVPRITDHGTRTVPKFEMNDLPTGPITISAAARAWLAAATPEYQSKAPNFVHWGLLEAYKATAPCPMVNPPPRKDPQVDIEHEFKQIYVGYSTEGSCVEAPPVMSESALIQETGTGALVGYYEVRKEFDYAANYDGDADEPDFGAHKFVYAGFQPPEVTSSALLSGSLVVLFLTLYFLPALKFTAVKGLLLIPGYAKLRKEELLDNQIRDQILQVVRGDPGVNTTDLSKRVDAGWGTVVYHLGVLEKNKLISSLVDGRYHRFFPVGMVDWSARGQIAALKNERTRQLYELIQQDPGAVQEALARRVGISPPAAFWHLKRLEEVGMVGRVKKGRRVHYYANEGNPLAKPPSADAGMEIQ